MLHALRFAADGFAVFPVHEPFFNMPSGAYECSCTRSGCRGKHPRTPNGVLDATLDVNLIREWWTKWPNASIGIATGKKSGLAVVDLDGADGIASGKSLGLSSTITALTGNGQQLFYADSSGGLKNSVKKLAAGVDTRGEGGYVVAPPSLHPNGKRYSWQGQPLSRKALIPLPAAFAEIATPTGTCAVGGPIGARKPEGWIAEALDQMRNGHVANTLVSVIGKFRYHSFSEADTVRFLKPHALVNGQPFEGLEAKVHEIFTRYEASPRAAEPAAKSEAIDAFLEDIKKVEWICEPIIAQKSIGFVAGLPETCKTWLLMDLAVESARKQGLWLGLFPTTSLKVLFIDQERFKGETQRRFNALIAGKSLKREDLRQSLFIKSGTTIKLDLPASLQAFRTELMDLRPDLVIVDSFATFHNSPENDRMAIQAVLNNIKALRDEVGCAFIFINHESKMVFQHVEDNKNPNAFDMLGSVGIVAAAEFCLTVRKIEPGLSMCHHTKSTLATASKSFTVALQDLPDGGITVRGTL